VETIEKKITEYAIIGEVNDALAAMYQITSEQMVGRPVREFAPNCGQQWSIC
jgi:hypothetical protein